ncbi:MAG: hypothetical protein AAGF79_17450 [Pseudomonadota bacterium]
MFSPTRRSAIAGASAFALTSPYLAAADSQDFDAVVLDVRQRLTDFHTSLRFTEVEAAPIVTGLPDFNDGLQFDEGGVLAGFGQFVIQPAARADDASEKDRKGVLPMFHIFSVKGFEDDGPDLTILRYSEVLFDLFRLDRNRIAFVSVPNFKSFQPYLEQNDLWHQERVTFRDEAEAKAAGDGSGYFRLPNSEAGMYTAGLYYALSDAPGPAGNSEDWLEIGELVTDPSGYADYSFGLERVAMATSGIVPTWESRLSVLQDQITRDT